MMSARTRNRSLTRATCLRSKQFLHFVPFQSFRKRFLASQGGLNELAFAGLQFEDFFFNSLASDELVARHYSCLANAMGSVGGLCFDGRIPPGIEMNDRIGSS